MFIRRLGSVLSRLRPPPREADKRPALVQPIHKLGPIVLPPLLPGRDGENINGPSLIKAPDWLPNRLGKYYLYFAHHHGDHIRLAVADELSGPYRIHLPGSLRLDQCSLLADHIASPDVHVDDASRRIIMYFHGKCAASGKQLSYRAQSPDGVTFSPLGDALGGFYFRVWSAMGCTYALAKARLYRSTDGGATFVEGPAVQEDWPSGRSSDAPGSIRHTAVYVRGHLLEVYFSRLGDAPESIRRGVIDMREPWTQWRLKGSRLVLAPTEPWEGALLPRRRSASGRSRKLENAVRDPAIYEENGQRYILYSVQGEAGIALARLPSD